MKSLVTFFIAFGLVLQASHLHAQQAPGNKGPDVEAKLKQLGIKLPTPAKPIANYVG